MAASAFSNGKYYLNIRSGYMAPVTLHCSYGDSGETITFYILDGSDAYNLTGSTVSLHGIRRDGANFGPFACTVSVANSSVSFTLQSSMTAVEGSSIGELTITRSGATIGTCNFGILVENAVFPNGVTYDTDPSVYQDILRYVHEGDSAVLTQVTTITGNLQKNIESYSSNTASALSNVNTRIDNTNAQISSIVAQAGNSNTEIVAARTAYDGTQYTTLGDHLKTIEEDFDKRISEANYPPTGFDNALWLEPEIGYLGGNVGSTYNVGTQTYWVHFYIPVNPGERYRLDFQRQDSSSTAHVIFIDSSDKIVAKEVYGADFYSSLVKNYCVTVPNNTVLMVVNSFNNLNTYKMDGNVRIARDSYDYTTGTIKKIIGTPKYKEELLSVSPAVGSVRGNIGSAPTYTSLTYWSHAAIQVNPGEIYKINTRVNFTVSASVWMAYWLDAAGKILAKDIPVDIGGRGSNTYDTSVRYIKNYLVVAPYGAKQLIVQAEHGTFDAYASIYQLTPVSLQSQLNRLIDTDLPEYYFENDYWPNLLDKINKKSETILNGVSFIFITDLHFGSRNDEVSKYMVRSILENSTVPFCICGGDFVQAYGDEENIRVASNAIKDYEKVIGKNRFFVVRGNHDFTIKADSSQTTGADDTGVTMGMNFTYDAIARNQEPYVYGSNPTNLAWYIDIPMQKTRIIGLNSCDKENDENTKSWDVSYQVRKEQVDWLLDEALSKEGYRYIFVSHIPADSTLGGHSGTQYVFQEIFVAMKNKTLLNYTDTYNDDIGTVTHDFTNTTSTAVCFIAGHHHADESHKDRNFLGITTTCDACYQDDGYGATRGTITAHGFDVFFVNYDTGAIDAIRCGRGVDRSWTY